MTRVFSEQHRTRLSKAAKSRCTEEWRNEIAERQRTQLDDERLRSLYESGMTQAECATELNVSQKVVWRALKRLGIKSRIAAKRNQRGPANSSWRGSDASYQAFHKRVEVARGTPKACDVCGANDESKIYDWANLTGNYHDTGDYKRMCRSCHRQYDNERGKNARG